MKTRFFLMMDKNKKKSGLLLMAVLLLGLVIGASSFAAEPESVAGYIVLEGNTLSLDEVEVITLEDKDRIADLGLDEWADMPNGYYIHDLDSETKAFELTDETVYSFTDFYLLFVDEADGDRLYKTTKKEEFIQHLNTSYSNDPPSGGNVPYFIEVQDGKVLSITEKFLYTQ